MQVPDVIINETIMNESAFSQNVPCNSTVCMNNTMNRTAPMPATATNQDNTLVLKGLINQDRTLQLQSEAPGRQKHGLDVRPDFARK